MGFEVKIILDSVNKQGNRITTWQLKYPRFIHSEFMTHREFSRNASSSRAIPVAKMIQMVRDDPATPIHWGKNQPGMQAHEVLNEVDTLAARNIWFTAADMAATSAELMCRLGAHKQVVNRILEPFQWISVVMTTTSMSNFFGLRNHPDAQPEIRHLAQMMLNEYVNNEPTLLMPGEWHLPYVTQDDIGTICNFLQINNREEDFDAYIEVACKVSAARCARVSYLTHEGKVPDILADIDLFDKLVGSQPLHASPTEHQATPDVTFQRDGCELWVKQYLHGNFTGWIQFRKTLPGEYIY